MWCHWNLHRASQASECWMRWVPGRSPFFVPLDGLHGSVSHQTFRLSTCGTKNQQAGISWHMPPLKFDVTKHLAGWTCASENMQSKPCWLTATISPKWYRKFKNLSNHQDNTRVVLEISPSVNMKRTKRNETKRNEIINMYDKLDTCTRLSHSIVTYYYNFMQTRRCS